MVYNSHDFDEPSSRWENAMDRYEDSRDDWDDEPEEDDK